MKILLECIGEALTRLFVFGMYATCLYFIFSVNDIPMVAQFFISVLLGALVVNTADSWTHGLHCYLKKLREDHLTHAGR